VVDGRRTGLCQLSGSGNICERAILVSGNICILTVSWVMWYPETDDLIRCSKVLDFGYRLWFIRPGT